MQASTRPESIQGIPIIDADTHLTEPADTWWSRAPADLRERLPRVVSMTENVAAADAHHTQSAGRDMWVFDGHVLGPTGGSCVIRPDGSKCNTPEFIDWDFDEAIPAAYELEARVRYMDSQDIWAQIVYPNVVGFGGQAIAEAVDPELRTLASVIWNDAMAEMQEESGNRLFPMGLVPWWDLDAAVAEVKRIAALGLKGLCMTADTASQSLPDLGESHWNPLWETASESDLSINFHIGSSSTQVAYYGMASWDSLEPDAKIALGSSVIYLANARVIGNMIFSGVLERFPDLKVVSVESGIGWIPFFLEALDYQMRETASVTAQRLSLTPSEYFQRNMYGCFWFEERDVLRTIERIGVDRCLFETDFPHPTCLYPTPLDQIGNVLVDAPMDTRRKLLCENAAKVYNIAVPDALPVASQLSGSLR